MSPQIFEEPGSNSDQSTTVFVHKPDMVRTRNQCPQILTRLIGHFPLLCAARAPRQTFKDDCYTLLPGGAKKR
jgi:hypothetical protein